MLTFYQSQTTIIHWFITNSKGFMEDLDVLLDVLNWRIFEAETAYTQIEPAGSGWTTLDLVANRVGLGDYKIEWTVPVAATVGRYYLEVQIIKEGITQQTQRMEFEVITDYIPLLELGTHMCLIRDLRAEGVEATLTDWRLAEAIIRGDAFIEHYCRRKFGCRKAIFKLEVTFDGQIMLPEAIIGLESVITILEEQTYNSAYIDVYNRHLRKEGGAPIFGNDDRDNPKLVISEAVKGTLVDIKGLWGYTQPDTTYVGKVPDQIKLAAINLALKYSSSLLGNGGGSSGAPSFSERIIEQKTATQSYKLSPMSSTTAAWDMVAGDTELARLLKPYMRPIMLEIV